jgi:hypothetical protein
MPGASGVHVEPAGGRTWLVLSHVPERDYTEAAVAQGLQDINWVSTRAIAHEAVVEHFLRARAVLPMQLFTLFTSDERALEYVTRNRRRLERVLDRVERQHEWGVRLLFQEPVDGDVRDASRAASRTNAARLSTLETGAGYLARKRDQRNVSREQLAKARTHSTRAYRAMAREASAARRRTATEQATPNSRLLVDAAFLVPVARTAAFRAALRRHARDLEAKGISVAATGPWPPYNFIDSGRGRS